MAGRAYFRAVTLVILGMTSSEVLFGNLIPGEALIDPWLWLVYPPLLILLDDARQRWGSGQGHLLLLGIAFGIWMEAVLMGMGGEGALMLGLLCIWHALFTVFLSFRLADLFWPLAKPVLLPSFVRAGLLGVAFLVGGLFLIYTHDIILESPFVHFPAFMVMVLILYGVSTRRRVAAPPPKVSVYLLLSVLGLGFGLGGLIIDIHLAEGDLAKRPYLAFAQLERAVGYALLAGLAIAVAIKNKTKTTV